MRGLSDADWQALRYFAEQIRVCFPQRVLGIQLIGSPARGEGTTFADIDVIIVLTKAAWRDRRIIGRMAANARLESGRRLNARIFSTIQFDSLKSKRTGSRPAFLKDLVPIE
jgi:predicted nucleotidyltransferase